MQFKKTASMRSGATQETARASSMIAFLASVLGRYLHKDISEAGMASIDCSILCNDDGIKIRIIGMSDKIHLLLREILIKMAIFDVTE